MSRIHYKSLPEKTADMISDMLYRDNYRVGAKLPNEMELAKMMEVSRNTVRQAIKILVDRNVLTVERGSGTFVSAKVGLSDDPLGLSMIGDRKRLVMDLLEVRMLIEPRMAALAAEKVSVSEIEQLMNICQRLEEACRQGKNYYELDMEFHMFIAGCSGNLVIHSLYPAICHTIELQEHLTSDRMKERTVQAHRRIYQAIAAHRGSEASDAMMAHLIQNRERMLQQLESDHEI